MSSRRLPGTDEGVTVRVDCWKSPCRGHRTGRDHRGRSLNEELLTPSLVAPVFFRSVHVGRLGGADIATPPTRALDFVPSSTNWPISPNNCAAEQLLLILLGAGSMADLQNEDQMLVSLCELYPRC